MEYDLIVRNGYVVDGTGLPRRRVDVAVKDGRIARIARMDGVGAKEEIDAKGRIVAPGIVDAHTHYDPQITFDPYATMSCYHGVTTVLAGNCGFSAAPVKAVDRTFIQGVFAKVEDMDPIALSGVAWESYETFEEFLNHVRADLGINFACYVGHSNVRRWVMSEACNQREATPDEIAQMAEIVEAAVRAGAAGFSSSSLGTQNDIWGRPVPSRFASHEEILALAEAAGRVGTGTICYLPAAPVSGMKDEDNEFITEIGRRSGLPVIIQGLGAMSKTDVPGDAWDAAVVALDKATAEGAPFYSMLEEANATFTLHIGTELMFFRTMDWGNAKAFEGFKINDEISMDPWRLSAMHLAPQNYFATMITGGVFDRHPRLRVGAMEYCAHWIGPLAEMLDLWHDNNQSIEPSLFADGSMGRRLPMRPSEYINRNIRVAPFEFEPVGKYIEKYGLEDVYCYNSDYPHVEGGKNPVGKFAASLEPLGPRIMEKFFISNGEWLLPA